MTEQEKDIEEQPASPEELAESLRAELEAEKTMPEAKGIDRQLLRVVAFFAVAAVVAIVVALCGLAIYAMFVG